MQTVEKNEHSKLVLICTRCQRSDLFILLHSLKHNSFIFREWTYGEAVRVRDLESV